MKIISALFIGAIFGLGIVISGMGNPAKVLNFFDFIGTWDPSLAFVMGGALAVAIPGYVFIFRSRKTPVLDTSFHLPSSKKIDAKLVGGAAVFGVGWGIAGFCPGGAVPVIGLWEPQTFIFLGSMMVGIALARIAVRQMESAPEAVNNEA